jgi:branched-chain amino acid transport system substrate-binding protein
MSQKNNTPALILSLLLTLVFLGTGIWWFTSRLNLGIVPSTNDNLGASDNKIGSTPTNATATRNGVSQVRVQDRLSFGEKILLEEGASAEKQAGVQAFANGDFDQAVANLEASIQAQSNDPEALIYLNNAQIGTRNAYVIAVSVPLATSINPALEILRGVAQAQNEINQLGGINGVPLKVMIANDDNSPDICKQVATALVGNAEILGVVGHFGSEATLAAAPIYQDDGLVMVSPTSTSVQISELGDSIYRTVPSDRFTASALSRYMLNTLQQQNAVIYFNSDSDYSKSLKNEFTTALYSDGGQIVGEFDLADPAFDPAASVEQASQQGAQILVLLSNTDTLDEALQVVAVNRRQLQLLGGDSLYNPKTLQIGGDAAITMTVAVPWVLLSDPQAPFVQASRQLWGGDVNWRTAMAYDAAQVLIEGLKRNPSRDGVAQALRASDFSVAGATGTVRFLPSGDRNQAMQLVIVQPGSRSGYGYDFVPVSTN